MSSPQLKMQDAKELAAGYQGWFRKVEIFSIASFWLLMFILTYRVWPHTSSNPWLVVSALIVGFLLADFVSGFVHWLADTWGRTDMPVIGKSLLRPFREHHVDPKAMTHHDYIETNGANCMISLPPALGAAIVSYNPQSDWYRIALFTSVAVGSMIFFVMMTNQIHKWSHSDAPPHLVVWLQRLHLILPPEHHQRHHTAPFNSYYCITTGWLNWPLYKMKFYPTMERMITAMTGAIPRQDDIGLEAAMATVPPPVAQPTDAELNLKRT